MIAAEHNPGEPQFGEHADEAEHNPGEQEFGEEETSVQEDEELEEGEEPTIDELEE